MDNIGDIISSLSEQDIENLKQAAQSIFGNDDNDDKEHSGNNSNQKKGNNPFPDLGGIDPKMLGKLSLIMSNMNKSNPRSDLISALIPLISSEKQKKANDAMKILQLIDILPLLKDMT